MKFSLKWLGDFIEVKQFLEEPENLAKALTTAGLEVESFEDQKDRLKNVVIAQLESVEKHPQADRLTLCKVSTGSKIYSVVCGAKNHKRGDKVVLAKPGAVLPGGFSIKKTRIRNIDSEGMLASKTELGLNLDSGKSFIESSKQSTVETGLDSEKEKSFIESSKKAVTEPGLDTNNQKTF